jgi:hypothetical protein
MPRFHAHRRVAPWPRHHVLLLGRAKGWTFRYCTMLHTRTHAHKPSLGHASHWCSGTPTPLQHTCHGQSPRTALFRPPQASRGSKASTARFALLSSMRSPHLYSRRELRRRSWGSPRRRGRLRSATVPSMFLSFSVAS